MVAALRSSGGQATAPAQSPPHFDPAGQENAETARRQPPGAAAHAGKTSQLKEVSMFLYVQLGRKKKLTNTGRQQRVVAPISAYATHAKKGTDASPVQKSYLTIYPRFFEL
jgi:hypothetical protein